MAAQSYMNRVWNGFIRRLFQVENGTDQSYQYIVNSFANEQLLFTDFLKYLAYFIILSHHHIHCGR